MYPYQYYRSSYPNSCNNIYYNPPNYCTYPPPCYPPSTVYCPTVLPPVCIPNPEPQFRYNWTPSQVYNMPWPTKYC